MAPQPARPTKGDEMTDTVLMEEMTWPEIKEAMAAGRRTAILACGASEQHGPHLPTGTDAYLGTAIAERAARIAGNALVAPTLRPGLSEHHMHFPGSFTLRVETFVALLEDYCESLARQGFERIVIFPSHGGNGDVMRAYGPKLARSQQGRCEVVMRAGTDIQKVFDVLAARGVGIGAAGVHAGYAETSEMLEAQPHLVRVEAFEPGRCDEEFYKPENSPQAQMDSFLYGIQTQTPIGVLGDPTGANAEAGREILEVLARSLAAVATAPARGGERVAAATV
jgi:creatinine amidohydrolase